MQNLGRTQMIIIIKMYLTYNTQYSPNLAKKINPGIVSFHLPKHHAHYINSKLL